MTVLYFSELDFFCESTMVRHSPKLSSLDSVECTESEANMFFYKTESTENGKQRKTGTLELEDIPAIEQTDDEKIAALESERDTLLKGSDWYVVRKSESGVDIPVEISEYRESLRTIDELEGYPDIDLPDQPEGIKFIY